MAKTKSAEIIFTDNIESAIEGKPRIRKQWTKDHKIDGEVNREPSQTLPDTSMSLKTMFERTKRGLPINSGGAQPVWNGEKLLPDWKRLDLIDRANVVRMAKEDKAKKEQIWKKQKDRVDAAIAEANRLKAEKEQQQAEKIKNEATSQK